MNLDLYFPTPIWWEKTDIDLMSLYNFCQTLKVQDPVGVKLSNHGGWQSQSLKPSTYRELHQLQNLIFELSSRCIIDMGYTIEKARLDVLNMWVNINQKHNHNNIHTHQNATISGVFYVQCNPDSGRIEFYRNFSDQFIIESQGKLDKSTPLSHAVAGYTPEPGTLILFPAHIPHSVQPNNTDVDRISIAFNVGLSYGD